MNIFLWILQILLGLLFFYSGVLHFILPSDLPEQMVWMYELSSGMHYFAGTVEILASLGLIIPGLVRIQVRLTPLAALGLVLVMFGAAIWHIPRNAIADIIANLILAGFAGFVAFGRWRLSPLKGK